MLNYAHAYICVLPMSCNIISRNTKTMLFKWHDGNVRMLCYCGKMSICTHAIDI